MSTRCMIEVEGNPVKLYRHSDGYPNSECGVLATLVPHVKQFLTVCGWDVEYLIARLAQWQMNESDQSLAEWRNNNPSPFNQAKGPECLSFGLSTEYHGDLEYVYIVKMTDKKPFIYVYEFDYQHERPGRCIKAVALS